MPDALSPERRSPSTGLPILSTTPLTAAEREQLRAVKRQHAAIAAELEALLAAPAPRVDQALDLLNRSSDLTGDAYAVYVMLGRGR